MTVHSVLLMLCTNPILFVILKRKTVRLRIETGSQNLRSASTQAKPQDKYSYALFSPPKDADLLYPVFLLSAYAATVSSYAYLCFTTFPRIFKDHYGSGSGATGLASIELGISFVRGLYLSGAVSDRLSAYLTNRSGARPSLSSNSQY